MTLVMSKRAIIRRNSSKSLRKFLGIILSNGIDKGYYLWYNIITTREEVVSNA